MVVSAGVKSILDIGLTLEYLETQVTTGTYILFYTRTGTGMWLNSLDSHYIIRYRPVTFFDAL
jgi:pseudouridine-5'-phosphate glycosidase